MNYLVNRTQLHTAIPSGAFTLQVQNPIDSALYLAQIDYNSNADKFRDAIQALSDDFTVLPTCPTATSRLTSSLCPRSTWCAAVACTRGTSGS